MDTTKKPIPNNIEGFIRNMFDETYNRTSRENYRDIISGIRDVCNEALTKYEKDNRRK